MNAREIGLLAFLVLAGCGGPEPTGALLFRVEPVPGVGHHHELRMCQVHLGWQESVLFSHCGEPRMSLRWAGRPGWICHVYDTKAVSREAFSATTDRLGRYDHLFSGTDAGASGLDHAVCVTEADGLVRGVYTWTEIVVPESPTSSQQGTTTTIGSAPAENTGAHTVDD